MTDQQSQHPEPTPSEILAAINSLVGRIDAVDARVDYSHRQTMAKIDGVKAEVAGVVAAVSGLSAEVSGVSQTVIAVKTDLAIIGARAVDAQNAVRVHQADPGAHGQPRAA